MDGCMYQWHRLPRLGDSPRQAAAPDWSQSSALAAPLLPAAARTKEDNKGEEAAKTHASPAQRAALQQEGIWHLPRNLHSLWPCQTTRAANVNAAHGSCNLNGVLLDSTAQTLVARPR